MAQQQLSLIDYIVLDVFREAYRARKPIRIKAVARAVGISESRASRYVSNLAEAGILPERPRKKRGERRTHAQIIEAQRERRRRERAERNGALTPAE